MILNKIKINDTATVIPGVVYDISKATGQTYETFADALGTDGNNVPPEVREGGMSIRYVKTSDNKYVQYRLTAQTFSTDEADWQKQGPEVSVLQNTSTGGYNLVIGDKTYSLANQDDANILLDSITSEKTTPTIESKKPSYFVRPDGTRGNYYPLAIFGVVPVKRGDICYAIINGANDGTAPLSFGETSSTDSDLLCTQLVAYHADNPVYAAIAEFDGYLFISSKREDEPTLTVFTPYAFEQIETNKEAIETNKEAIEDIANQTIQVSVQLGKDSYFVRPDGTRGSYSPYGIFGPIPVKQGTIVIASNFYNINAGIAPLAWSSSPSMNSDMACTVLAEYNATATEYKATIPNDGYLFISNDKTTTPTLYMVFSISDVLKKGKLLEKKIAWFGDSITEGYGQLPYVSKYGWATPIANEFGAECDNQGVSGATLRDQTGVGRVCIPMKLKDYIDNGNVADYFILSGGFNDRDNSSQWGTVQKNSYSEYADLAYTTTTEALEKMIAYCMLNLSDKKFGFIICYDLNDVPENVGWEPAHWNELADRLIDACNKWGMPYLDLRKTCGFNLCTDGLRAIYGVDLTAYGVQYDTNEGYSADARVIHDDKVYKAKQQISAPAGDFDSTKWEQISDDYGFDRSHCNRFAYDKMANIVGQWIETL